MNEVFDDTHNTNVLTENNILVECNLFYAAIQLYIYIIYE